MSENCSILLLPSEILVLLVDFLPGKDIISFSLTCRRFSDVCRNFLRCLKMEKGLFRTLNQFFITIVSGYSDWKIAGRLEL
jgi:hypothetical protein